MILLRAREECLMFFRKKQKVDLDAKFKEVYHEVNKLQLMPEMN